MTVLGELFAGSELDAWQRTGGLAREWFTARALHGEALRVRGGILSPLRLDPDSRLQPDGVFVVTSKRIEGRDRRLIVSHVKSEAGRVTNFRVDGLPLERYVRRFESTDRSVVAWAYATEHCTPTEMLLTSLAVANDVGSVIGGSVAANRLAPAVAVSTLYGNASSHGVSTYNHRQKWSYYDVSFRGRLIATPPTIAAVHWVDPGSGAPLVLTPVSGAMHDPYDEDMALARGTTEQLVVDVSTTWSDSDSDPLLAVRVTAGNSREVDYQLRTSLERWLLIGAREGWMGHHLGGNVSMSLVDGEYLLDVDWDMAAEIGLMELTIRLSDLLDYQPSTTIEIRFVSRNPGHPASGEGPRLDYGIA